MTPALDSPGFVYARKLVWYDERPLAGEHFRVGGCHGNYRERKIETVVDSLAKRAAMSSSKTIEFNLLNNARDSLRQAVQLLAFDDNPRSESRLKHAVVNTAYCVELFLKERLRRVDPALVQKEPRKYPSVSAHTVTVDKANERLRKDGNITIRSTDKLVLENFGTARNAKMHYEWSITAKTAKVIIGEGLSFAFSFGRAELGIDLAKDFQTDDTWRSLLEELYQFTESYRKRLRAIMCARGGAPVECTNCGEEAASWLGGICELCGHWQDFEPES